MNSETHHSAEVREGATAGPTFPTLHELIAAEKGTDAPVLAKSAELAARRKQGAPPTFPPLDRETRAAVDTATAAYHLNRQPQTLRGWACNEDGPLRPLRINGRLAWPTALLRKLCGVA